MDALIQTLKSTVVGQELWNSLLKSWPYSDKLLFFALCLTCHEALFASLNVALHFIRKWNLFKKYKIHEQDPPSELVWTALKDAMINHIIINPLAYWFAYDFFLKLGMNMRNPLPPVAVIIAQLFFCMCCEDTLFYWSHRALHHPSIYKHVHKQHHKFKYSIGLASQYAHPIENIANSFNLLFGPVVLRAHPVVFLLWFTIRIAETVDAHSGYQFPFSPFEMLLKIQGGSARHDFHHSHNVGSYGSWFKFWDWVCGTDKPFKEYQAKLKSGKAKHT
eukprot:TRINITY_DN6862_c0_g5_i1.p1 TRINITY_DN6862_c0_g5~~TRINITY_DN6862_c0_g5_i1.p1  ORF type:complete len:276 (-),score=48.30 TRINITY_DN6862_c0_g5_i1:287-1114(-)